MNDIQYLKTIQETCLYCHSCRCFHATSMIGSVCYGELATMLLEGNIDLFEESIFGCHQCNMCLKKCPKQFNAKEFMHHARSYIENLKPEHCQIYKGVRVDLEENVFTKLRKQNQINYQLIEGKSDRLFVPGCHMSSGYKELTQQVYNYLLKQDIVDGMLTKCCGNPLYASGLENQHLSYLKEMDTFLKEQGVKLLTTPCPNCYDYYTRMQKEGYFQDIEIHCLSKDLVDHNLYVSRKHFPDDYVISIHDSCPDRKNGIYASSLRELYKDFDIVELKHHKENSLCCGCGGLVPPYSPSISLEGKTIKHQEYQETKASCLVTSCFNCYNGLKTMMNVHQYLQDFMEDKS